MVTIVILIGVFIFQFRSELETAYEVTGRAAAPIRSTILTFPEHYREILVAYFSYYNRLNQLQQTAFEQKLLYFILSKKFIPRQIDTITDEMKVMIGACAVQLTFGLPRVYLQHFDKIIIYPTEYYSAITKKFHKGEVNPAFGAIVLSWKSFVDGYIYPTDALNLGLHEMAHALRLENIIHNDEHEFFDDELVARFDSIASQMCSLPDQSHQPLLRAYACANPHEFFSVAIENFFEKPTELKTSLPELYSILMKLLNQDPAHSA